MGATFLVRSSILIAVAGGIAAACGAGGAVDPNPASVATATGSSGGANADGGGTEGTNTGDTSGGTGDTGDTSGGTGAGSGKAGGGAAGDDSVSFAGTGGDDGIIGGGGTGGAPPPPPGGGPPVGPTCTPPSATPSPEACGDGLDNDLNGFVDENCKCPLGTTQPCFGGLPVQVSDPVCSKGTQKCSGSPEFPSWGPCEGWKCGTAPPPPEVCENGLDDDCDGLIDEGCILPTPVDFKNDCIQVACPPMAPFPAGCKLTMEGGDSRGCVALVPGNPSNLYFQEGNNCPIPGIPPELQGGAGNLFGQLLCSPYPGTVIDNGNCTINKPETFFAGDPGGCPK